MSTRGCRRESDRTQLPAEPASQGRELSDDPIDVRVDACSERIPLLEFVVPPRPQRVSVAPVLVSPVDQGAIRARDC